MTHEEFAKAAIEIVNELRPGFTCSAMTDTIRASWWDRVRSRVSVQVPTHPYDVVFFITAESHEECIAKLRAEMEAASTPAIVDRVVKLGRIQVGCDGSIELTKDEHAA